MLRGGRRFGLGISASVLALSLGLTIGLGLGSWPPSQLSNLRAWYDPADLSTLYQDSAGTTPVTAPGQPVGLVLDKSRGLVRGAELWSDASVLFFGAASRVSANTYRIYSADGTNSYVQVSSALTIGKTYEVTFNIDSIALLGGGVRVGDSGEIFTTLGVKRSFYVAAGNNHAVIKRASSACDIQISNVSVREIPGHHLIQATAAKRPEYGIMPKGGVRNLLTYSEDFSNAAWAKHGTTVTPTGNGEFQVTGLDAGADRVDYNTTTPVVAGETWTYSVELRGTGSINIAVNPTTGNANGGAIEETKVLTSEWVRHTVTHTFVAPVTGNIRVHAVITRDGANPTVYLRKPQLERGPTPTAYQKVVSAREVTEAGQPSLSYLYFDGADDALATSGNVDLTGTDAVSVFAGVRKESDASAGGVVELSTASSSAAGSFGIFAPWTAGGSNYGARVTGSLTNTMFGGIAPAPVTSILSILADISSDSMYLRSNGLQIASRNDDLGTGNFGSYPLYIGARAGTSLYFKGNLYGLVLRGALSTADEINSVERWLAQRTGVVL